MSQELLADPIDGVENRMDEDPSTEQQLIAERERADNLQAQLDALRINTYAAIAAEAGTDNGADKGAGSVPTNDQQPRSDGNTGNGINLNMVGTTAGTGLSISDVQSLFSVALTSLGEKLLSTFQSGNISSSSAPRFDVKAVNRKLQWAGHTDKRNPEIFLIQLNNQLEAANATTDKQRWQVVAELMDVAPLEMLSKRFGTVRTAPFAEFHEWFLTTFTSLSVAARDVQVLELLTDFHGKLATTVKSVQTTGGLVSTLETEFNRLVTFNLPDQLKIFFLSKYLPANLAKEARIDPSTSDLYTSFDLFKQRVLAIASASAAGSQKTDK